MMRNNENINMDKRIDHSTLNWVKQEIDETLGQARHSLEEYVDNSDDETQLRFCFTYIHQVFGTLQMVELYGASLLAEEMEQLVRSLLDNEVSQKEDAYEVLMMGIVRLPDYLEQIQAGIIDDPLILLPLLNDLRAARGEHLMSENALFSPDISLATPIFIEGKDNKINSGNVTDVRELARKLRHQFQVGLLSWFRDNDSRKGFESIGGVLGHLEMACTHEEVVRLWWVGSGLVEALLDEGIESSISLKLLLGQLDREIKRLIETSEQELAENLPEGLLKNLLYYVAQSNSSGQRVTEVKEKFNLAGLLPGHGDINAASESISAPNAEMMKAVTVAIQEDFANVKDALDLYLRSNDPDIQSLEPQVEVLRKTADTLGMLCLGASRKIVKDQADLINDLVEGKGEANEDSLMKIAGSLLYVESSLEGLSAPGAVNQAREEQSQTGNGDDVGHQLPASEIHHIKFTVLEEVEIDIAQVKDAIASFIDAPMDHALLECVPDIIERTRGSLQMISENHAANLLNSVNQYISSDLLEKKGTPDQDLQEALADVIASIEYHLEAVMEYGTNTSNMLTLAHEALAKLGHQVDMPDENLSSIPEDPEISQPLKQEGQVNNAEKTIETNELSLSVEIDQHDEAAPKSRIDLEDDLDEDILEIFIEEAEEELGVINELLPKWKENFEDNEALSRFRRAFHTMKGSGRMVGATVIGELAWSVENMLNRVLDNTISASDEISQLIQDVVETMQGLVNQLKGEDGPDQNIVQGLIDHASTVANSGKEDLSKEGNEQVTVQEDQLQQDHPLTDAEEKVEEESEEEGEVGVKDGDPGSDVMDSALYDIFMKESAGHLEEIHGFISRCQGNQEHCIITDALVRAFHTLHGSARMAGATNIAEIGGMLEKYIKVLMGNNALLPENGLMAMVEGVEAIKEMLGKANQPDNESIDYSELQGRIGVLYSDELQEQEKRIELEHEAVLNEQADETADTEEEYDEEILEVFLEEGAELLDSSEMILQRWSEDIQNQDNVAELLRDIHTLKGGARMAGITAIGDLSHKMESLLTAIVDGEREATDGVVSALHRTLDSLFGMLKQTQEKQSIELATALMEELDLLRQGKEPVADKSIKEVELKPKPDVAAGTVTKTTREEYAPDTMVELPLSVKSIEPANSGSVKTGSVKAGSAGEGREEKVQHEMVRVRADLLDNLVNYAGEVSIYRSRLDQQVGAFGFNLVELEQTVLRLKEQLRKLEIETEAQILFRYEEAGGQDDNFDPLELDRYSHIQQLSRSLMESTSDISSIQGLLENQVRESETLLLQQSRVNTDLQEGLMRTRMVSFTGLVPRLQRIIRQTSQEIGKKAKLDLSGEQGEMDRSVLERITAPLEHMLRNAIAHGIEFSDERKKLGKPETGKISLSISREASDIVIVVTDDGAGLDLKAIRKKAIEDGLMSKSSDLSDQDIMQFVLESGFSTAEKVTQISGRGVGMDVVNSEIKQLGGSLHIESVFKQGTTFTIRLPFTLAINHALLVNVDDETYAVPLASVEGIVRLTKRELDHFYSDEDAHYPYAGQEYQVKNLSSMLGFGAVRNFSELDQKVYPVLLVRTGDHRTALQVDGLMGSREIVVKPVGPQISTLKGVSGATILGDGSVVLILDINSIIRLGEGIKADAATQEPVIVEQADKQLNVMVVDDSITVRKVTTRLLERHDIKVSTARDGVDAVTALQDHIPDVMLLDIEMPRMDGYELATYMRNEERFKNIPIIMITSRTGEKHRRRAEEIGVNRYLGKPYQESDLLENIEQLVQENNVNA